MEILKRLEELKKEIADVDRQLDVIHTAVGFEYTAVKMVANFTNNDESDLGIFVTIDDEDMQADFVKLMLKYLNIKIEKLRMEYSTLADEFCRIAH